MVVAGSGVRRIFLVRHGLPAVDPRRPAHEWELDPSGFADIDALRDSGRIPVGVPWFSSPEPKAVATAGRLTGAEINVVDDLREHDRHSPVWFEDFAGAVRSALDRPDEPAFRGWEPLRSTRDRVVTAVRRILLEHPEGDIVLMGHGTAWTLLMSDLAAVPPDLDAWESLAMPDLWIVKLHALP